MADKQPTQAQTLRAIRALGLTANVRNREYRITFPIDSCLNLLIRADAASATVANARRKAEAIAYYTNDRQDAIDTARFMSNRLPLKVRA